MGNFELIQKNLWENGGGRGNGVEFGLMTGKYSTILVELKKKIEVVGKIKKKKKLGFLFSILARDLNKQKETNVPSLPR